MSIVKVYLAEGVYHIRAGEEHGQYDCESVGELLSNLEPFTRNKDIDIFWVNRDVMNAITTRMMKEVK